MNYKKFALLSIFLSSYFNCSAISTIIPIENMQYFFTFINKFEPKINPDFGKSKADNPLILWDIDGTILVAQDNCLHPNNGDLFDEALIFHKDKFNDKRSLSDIKNEIMRQKRCKLTDLIIPQILQTAKALKYSSMILTSRGGLGESASKFMSQPGINTEAFLPIGMRKTTITRFNSRAKLSLAKNNCAAYAKDHILFCNGNPKNHCLHMFLEAYKSMANKIPATIIFIDDDINNIKTVQNTVSLFAQTYNVEIDFYGFYYTRWINVPIDEDIMHHQIEQFFQTKVWPNQEDIIAWMAQYDICCGNVFPDDLGA